MRQEKTRYSDELIISYKNENIYEIREKIDTSFKVTDEIHTVKGGQGLRDVAQVVYGDARLYWIIAEFNNIIDPFIKLEEGKELRYPSMLRINEEIL